MTATVPPPGDHGGDGPQVARALGLNPSSILDLSLSVNPLAPDPTPIVRRHAGSVRSYPHKGPATAALAEAVRVRSEQVLLTNGGAEAIALVATELPDGWVEEPEFSLYPRHLARIDPAAGRWRSNPHNPERPAGAPRRARRGVWDEAFYPLATGTWTRGDIETGAIVVGSVTKLLACPGLRLGYVLAGDADLIARLERRQPQRSVSAPAAQALPDLLEAVDLPRWSHAVAALRADLVALLARYGLQAAPSDACWVLVPGAGGLRRQLAPHGIVVRDCSSFGWPDTVRIAVPDPEGLVRLEHALGAVL